MDKPYAVLSIPIISLVVYLASLLAVRLGVFSKETHRKFWNILLLAAFLGAAGLGFLLALQVNYKFDLPAAAAYLKVHVDFGIAMLVIALLHLLRHFNYYLKIISPRHEKRAVEQIQSETITKNSGTDGEIKSSSSYCFLLPFCLGLTSMSAQIILLREFLSVFNGNELVIGVVLANWMLLTGAGAWLGRFAVKQKPTDTGPSSAIIALTVAAPATLFALDALRNLLFTTGSMVGILEVYITSLILLAPFCLTSGLLFTRLTALNALWPDKSSIGKVYAWESIGSVAGGALLNFVLVFFLRPFEAFGIIIAVNALLLGIWAFTSGVRRLLRSVMFIGFVFVGVIVFLNPDIAAKKLLLQGQQILKYTNSPFGDIIFTGSEGQRNLYENNTLIYTTNNIISNEESVHYAMLQRDNPKNVLLIGGCFPGVISEVLKYPVKKLDCIEMNHRLLEETKSTLGMPDDKRLNAISGDPVLYLRKSIQKVKSDNQDGSSEIKYDVVLLNLPDPYTLQVNRFYSLEFLQLLKPLMTNNGVVSLSLTATADYMGFSSRKVQSVMYATLKHIFSNVMVIPGDRNHFVASDSPVRIDVAALQVERGIETQYVNPYYIDDQSISERSQVLMKAIDAEAPVNHDFEPVAFKSQLDYWLDYFGISLRLLPVMLLLVILAVLLRSDGIGAGVFMAGFAASASEIAVLLAFQVLYGYVFIAAGMFITLFMLGLAIGAMIGRRYFVNPSFKAVTWLQVCMSVAMLAVSGVVYGFYKVHWGAAIIHIGFGLILLAIAMLTGIIFQVSSVVKKGEVKTVAGSLYGSDLLGSAIGALLMSIFMIPELGLFKSLLSLTVLCLFSVLVMLLKRKPVL